MEFSFTMLVGLPGSGKTTYAKWLMEEEPDTVWLSSDKIRAELYGDEEIQGDRGEVFDLMKRRTLLALKCGQSVIHDACNNNSRRRRALLTELKRFECKKNCVVLVVPYKECLWRSSHRERVVSEYVVERMYRGLQTPYPDEGWDRVELHMDDAFRGISGNPETFADTLEDFDQDNPHHMESLGTHLKDTRNWLLEKGLCAADSNLEYAALVHDCGKPHCQSYRDRNGNPTEYAHYYMHGNVGAYESLFFDYPGKNDEDILEISSIVNWHDRPFDTNWSEKKAAEVYGEKLCDDIVKIHRADIAAAVPVTKG